MSHASVSLALFCPSVYFVQTGGGVRVTVVSPSAAAGPAASCCGAEHGQAVVFSGRPASAAVGTAVITCARAELSDGWGSGTARNPLRAAVAPHPSLTTAFALAEGQAPPPAGEQPSPATALPRAPHLSGVSRASRICRCGFLLLLFEIFVAGSITDVLFPPIDPF